MDKIYYFLWSLAAQINTYQTASEMRSSAVVHWLGCNDYRSLHKYALTHWPALSPKPKSFLITN